MKKLFVFLLVWLLAMANLQAQAVDKEICPGTAFTINSTAAATSGSTYRWLENGKEISGATAANYTIPTTKTTGVYTYVRQSKSGSCSDWQGSNAYTVSVGHKPGSTATMQDFFPCNYTTNSTWVLTDARADAGGQTYTVRYLADGRFWMVDDLKYPTACGTRTSVSGFSTSQSTALGANISGFYGDCTNATNTSTPAGRGYLYDWMFVMQNPEARYGGSWDPGCTNNPGTKAACRGICPEGWHVPTGNKDTGEFTLLNNAVNSGSTTNPSGLRNTTTFNGVYGGNALSGSLNIQGSGARYWSSTYSNDLNAYHLGFYSTNVGPSYNGTKNYGNSLRCIRNY